GSTSCCRSRMTTEKRRWRGSAGPWWSSRRAWPPECRGSPGRRRSADRDAPLAEIAARVAGFGCRRSRFWRAGARSDLAAIRDAATQLHRPGRQFILERRQSVRELSAEAAAPSYDRPGNPARDAASILSDAVHPERSVLRALSSGPHSERRRLEHVATQPGGQRRATAP